MWKAPGCEGHKPPPATLLTILCAYSPPLGEERSLQCWITVLTVVSDWQMCVHMHMQEDKRRKKPWLEAGEGCPDACLVPQLAYWPEPGSCPSAWAGFGAGPLWSSPFARPLHKAAGNYIIQLLASPANQGQGSFTPLPDASPSLQRDRREQGAQPPWRPGAVETRAGTRPMGCAPVAYAEVLGGCMG